MASERAIGAAISALGYFHSEKNYQKMGTALDAAAAVDGDAQWNEAIEAAAQTAEKLNGWGSDYGSGGHADHIAKVIRALKRLT